MYHAVCQTELQCTCSCRHASFAAMHMQGVVSISRPVHSPNKYAGIFLPPCCPCFLTRRRAGYPFGTLVDFASDGGGLPIFCLSPLAIHARNLIEDPRCSLVVQMPGWTGLANARVTIFGDVYQLPADMQVCGARCTAAALTGAVEEMCEYLALPVL